METKKGHYMFARLVIKNRSGSGMVLGMLAMLILFAFGMSFLSIAMSSITTSKSDYLRARALAVAEAGVDKAIYYLRVEAPDGSTNGSWRTTTATVNPSSMSEGWYGPETVGANEEYYLCVRNAAGTDPDKIVITCRSTITAGGIKVHRSVKVLIERKEENVCVWNNVIFGGVGQAGKSIAGNVRMRGSVHLLGDGEEFTDIDGDEHWDDDEAFNDADGDDEYDEDEEYTDVDGDGHRDAREPFIDVNGNGTRDPALTVTDIAEDLIGTADVGNNYNGMPVALQNLLPALPTKLVGGENVETLKAKLRVKHGMVNISGSAVAGYDNLTGNTVKETLDGTYVSDGFGGTAGTASVNSDNGYSHGYDLGEDLVEFPALTDPYPGYDSYFHYLKETSLVIEGAQTLSASSFNYDDGKGNSISYDPTTHSLSITGKVLINGDLTLGAKDQTITYSGKGTLIASGNINVHSDVLPQTGFPETDVLGLIAGKNMDIATGNGDAQLKMALAMYAQYKITIGKQCEIAGSCVSSYFSMTNVPHIYQVPALAKNLPPGMPGSEPIYIITIEEKSWDDETGSVETVSN